MHAGTCFTRNRHSSPPTGDLAARAGVRVEAARGDDTNDLRSDIVRVVLAFPIRARTSPEEDCAVLGHDTSVVGNRVDPVHCCVESMVTGLTSTATALSLDDYSDYG